MNQNETYTYKQILLGLRTEFLKAQKILDELNNYIYNESKLFDYNFNLYRFPYIENNPELMLEKSIKNEKDLFNLLYKIFGQKTRRCTHILSDNNGNYYTKNNKFDIVINEKQKFKEEV